jgi:hypothetical protein
MGLLTETDQSYYEGNDYGKYQFTSLEDIINYFMIVYVGEEKIISKASRTDVAFHAQRAMQELSFDTFKSIKSQEIVLPPSNTMILPHDYVNYTRVLWSDSSGIKHPIYPTKHTQNPFKVKQDSDGNYNFLAAAGEIDLINSNFDSPVRQPWFKNGAVDNSASTSSNVATVSLLSDIVGVVGGKLQISTNPFAFTNNVGTFTTGRAYAIWQEIDVTDINEVSITATGSSAAEESTKANAGILRIGISSTPGHADANLKKNVPSLNDQIVSGGGPPRYGPNFLPGTNSTTSNNSFPNANTNNEVLEWNNAAGESEITKTLENINVQGYNKVYVLITSHTPFITLHAAISTNTIDNISVGYEGTSPHLPQDGDSTTWTNYKSNTPSENQDDYQDDTYWPNNQKRYGLDPQHAQVNGSFYVDNSTGLIHFSSNISGKTVILDYISDSLGTDGEMQVHKFAEEAMYKWIMYAMLSTRANTQEYIVQRYKKEKFAATRQAKLRLSNIKLEELTQILRGKSKHIKH